MAKQFIISFGASNYTGLAPTFLIFNNVAGTSVSPRPAITEIGPATGLYSFTYGPTNAIGFVIDANNASVPFLSRYISGSLDPIQAVDEQLTGVGNTLSAIGTSNISLGTTNVALGMSNIAIGTSLLAQGATILSYVVGFSSSISFIGSTASSFGNTAVDPSTIFGYLKRLQEFNEGDSTFNKTSGAWDIYSRGASTELRQKIVTDASGSVTKA